MLEYQNKKHIFLLLGFMAIGLILRLNNLSGRSLWTDEFFTLFQSSGHGVDIKILLDRFYHKPQPALSQAGEFKALLKFDPHKSIKDVNNSLFNTDTHPPLYFWIMYFWRWLFRDSVFALRFFSVLMGLFSVFLAYKVGYYLFSRDVAEFCALYVSISAFSIRYSQEARAYSLVMALGLLSWLFILKMENSNKYSDAFGFAIFNALGLYTHYFYIFISIAQFAYFTAVYHQDSARLRKFYMAFLCSALLFSPWFIPLILKGYNFYLADWIFGYPGLANKLFYLCRGVTQYIWMFDIYVTFLSLFLFIGFLLFIYLVSYVLKDMTARYPKQFFFCLIMFIVPLSAMFLIDIVQHGALLEQGRFWMFPLLGFIPLAGYALNYGFLRIRPVVFIIILLVLVSSVTISKMQFGPAPKYASLWINKESARKPSAVIVYNIRSVIFAQAYYLNDGIYLIPVSDQKQLNNAIKAAADYADKVFIVRHYHPSDASLMNQPFMETGKIDFGFKLKTTIYKDDIKVSEYTK